MTRLNYTLPFIAGLGLALTGCPSDDSGGAADTGGSAGTTGTPGDDGVDDGTPTSAGPTTTATTGAADEDSTEDGVDPCEDVECGPMEDCVAGSCIPSGNDDPPPECETWGEGAWADCADGEACGGNMPFCLPSGEEGEGSCMFVCEERCDCPESPDTGDALVTCGDIAGPGGELDNILECYLGCENGETCPDGQTCIAGLFCVHTNTVPAEPVPPYEGCNPPAFPCEEGSICVQAPDESTCAQQDCKDVGDCPEAPEGGTVACNPITAGEDPPNACHLTCVDGGACPEGWNCFGGFVCTQPSPQPPQPGFGGCNPLDNCNADETCYEVVLDGGSSGSGGSSSGGDSEAYNVCTAACVDAEDCPLAPGGGDADITCGDIGGGSDTCYLDCSDGSECPAGMVCAEDLYCAFDSGDVCGLGISDPSFEAGSPNPFWTEASTNFGTPLCTVDSCGGGASVTGDWFIWFGGVMSLEVGSVEQEITIPMDATFLTLQANWAVITGTNPEMDTFTVSIDGAEEYSASGADGIAGGYMEVQIDVSAYADDMPHTLLIESTTQGDELTSIFVDDIALVCG